MWRGGYADGGGYLIRCFFDIEEEALGGVATPDGSASTTGRRPARASFLGVRSLNLVLADFGTLLFFVLLFIFILSFLFWPSVNSRLENSFLAVH